MSDAHVSAAASFEVASASPSLLTMLLLSRIDPTSTVFNAWPSPIRLALAGSEACSEVSDVGGEGVIIPSVGS